MEKGEAKMREKINGVRMGRKRMCEEEKDGKGLKQRRSREEQERGE